MSDNIPFEIQIEKVYDVKSLIQFRSVSKPWKSFIDSYDDNNQTCKVQYSVYKVVGACHGLLCLFAYNKDNCRTMVVIWNLSIGKSFGIAIPRRPPKIKIKIVYGFDVCPVTSDSTVVKVLCAANMPWQVEVFTLTSGVWNVIPSGNLPRQSIQLNTSTQVVIDRFIYWGACEMTSVDDGRSIINHIVVSFDLITKDFKVVDLPDSLTTELNGTHVFVSKLRESLVVYGSICEGAETCSLWVMQHDSSFRKLFTIGSPICEILGFRNNSEPIFRSAKELGPFNTLDVYDPSSQQIKNLGIAKMPKLDKFSQEMKQNIKEFERILSESSSDPELPPQVEKKLLKMETTITKANAASVDCNHADKKLRQLADLTEHEANFHMKQSAFLYQLAFQTTPKSLHCLSMRLTVKYFKTSPVDADQSDSLIKHYPN
nr:probable galacturonosyltransferase 7 isoform X2 [Tanacetum cinerariifolium]